MSKYQKLFPAYNYWLSENTLTNWSGYLNTSRAADLAGIASPGANGYFSHVSRYNGPGQDYSDQYHRFYLSNQPKLDHRQRPSNIELINITVGDPELELGNRDISFSLTFENKAKEKYWARLSNWLSLYGQPELASTWLMQPHTEVDLQIIYHKLWLAVWEKIKPDTKTWYKTLIRDGFPKLVMYNHLGQRRELKAKEIIQVINIKQNVNHPSLEVQAQDGHWRISEIGYYLFHHLTMLHKKN